MGITLVDGQGGANLARVDSNGSVQTRLFGANSPLALLNSSTADPTTTYGLPIMGTDHRVARLVRADSDQSLRVNTATTLYLYDEAEGAAVDTNKWIQSTTTQTITQAGGVITLNAGSSVATTTGSMHTSHKQFPYVKKGGLIFRVRARPTAHFANNQHQLGFGTATSVTAIAVTNGAFWRKDGTGQYVPVLSIGGSEFLGNAISDATFRASIPTTDYCIFEIVLEQTRATFRILLSAGTLLNEQIIEFPASATVLQVTHLPVFYQNVNTGATGTAVQLLIDGVSVWGTDGFVGRPWSHAMAGMNYGAVTSPTAYTQLSNYANSAAPTSATLSNTAAGYSTFGGQWQFAAVAGAETDYALFGVAVPAPYDLYVTGIQIATWNMGAAVATTPTLLAWSLAINSSAVSLATGAPYTPMRVNLGSQSLPVGAAIGANVPDIVRTFQTPLHVFQSRFLHVILKMPVGTATASQIVRGTVSIDGYFE